MARFGPRPPRLTEAWKYALAGGLASIPLSLGHYWLSGMGNEFSANMVFFGGLLAGYLAERGSTELASVGLRAGAIGALPGLVWITPAMLGTARDFATAWSIPVVEVLFVGLFSGIVVGFAALVGLVGALVGGWLARKTADRRLPAAES